MTQITPKMGQRKISKAIVRTIGRTIEGTVCEPSSDYGVPELNKERLLKKTRTCSYERMRENRLKVKMKVDLKVTLSRNEASIFFIDSHANILLNDAFANTAYAIISAFFV